MTDTNNYHDTDTLSFKYESGVPEKAFGLRTHDVDVAEVSGQVYVYGAFDMCPVNPVPYEDGLPRFIRYAASKGTGQALAEAFSTELPVEKGTHEGRRGPRPLQIVTLGRMTGDGFIPVVRFGLVDDGRRGEHWAFITPWVNGGDLDYYSLYARPGTHYDYRIHLDLDAKTVTAFVNGRGDDRWYLITENAPLVDTGAAAVNHARVEQYPGAAGIRDLMICAAPYAEAEEIRPHLSTGKKRVVAEGRGFRFQPMRSVWGLPGRHVSIRRNPPRWYGFPSVCQVDEDTLACTYCDGEGHGGGGDQFVQLSHDLGRTWNDPVNVFESASSGTALRNSAGAWIQKLKDGSLLITCCVRHSRDNSVYYDNVSYRSYDGGKTWTDERCHPGENPLWTGRTVGQPSRVLEMPDGAWLKGGCWMIFDREDQSVYEPCQVDIWRSGDEGRTWRFLANINGFPPHQMDEPALMRLSDGRLLLIARGWSGLIPGTKAYSGDGGRTWEIHELPFQVDGRPCGMILHDGRAMVTFRSSVGRAALWAWIDDPTDTTGYRAAGAHFNDRTSVGMKEDGLHIDSDGVLGQFTRYYLRPADTCETRIDFTVEVKVVENAGRAATICVPFVGQFRLFPDRIELAGHPHISAGVTPGVFHTCRIVRTPGKATVYMDGEQVIETDEVDERIRGAGPVSQKSIYLMAIGNEPDTTEPIVLPDQIGPEVTGYSIWRRFEEILDDPKTGRHEITWSAGSGEFPDQYQLDHIIEVHASAVSVDQGYSGWQELEDGRIFVVDYTDDTAPPRRPFEKDREGIMGIAWIRGTYLLPTDLPKDTRRSSRPGQRHPA